MRILMIHEDPREPGEGGGAESILRDHGQAMKARGHKVGWWRGIGSIQQAVAEFEPDMIHVQTIHNHIKDWIPMMEWVQQSGIPHVWVIMDYWPFCGNRMMMINGDQSCPAVRDRCNGQCKEGPTPAVVAELVNGSPVVALNRFSQDIYQRNGINCEYVVEPGIDTELFKPDPAQRGEVSIYTSTAWSDSPCKGMHIVSKVARSMGITINLITGVSRDKVAATLKKADIYIFPSTYEETFGLCLCEAMASGCACIASDVAGARAQIDDRVTGLLVPPRDPAALREAIEYMLENKSHRESMGYVAYAHVLKSHTLDAMAARWEKVYREVMNVS